MRKRRETRNNVAFAKFNSRKHPAAPKAIKIAAFGDSLSAGYGLDPDDGFAPALQRALLRIGVSAKVFCAAVSGDKTADGLARISEMLAQRPEIVVVEFGYNDLYYGGEAAIVSAKKSLATMIARIQESGARVLLAGVHCPPDASAATRKKFAAMYESLRDEYNAPLYPSFLAGVISDSSLLLPGDDVHPSAKGVRKIAVNIAPRIAKIANDIRRDSLPEKT